MTTNSSIIIRKAETSDTDQMLEIDHSYHTDFVWQMDYKPSSSEIRVTFREVRLPRSMLVEYPNIAKNFNESKVASEMVFVAERNDEILGYLRVLLDKAPASAWISDLVVMRRLRRQGIGTSLARQAAKWAHEQDYKRITFEMQSKNFPAIKLANKLGYEFSGFNDQYFENMDIALFFSRRL